MSFLLAFQLGCEDGIDAAEKLNVTYSSGTADYWLENTPGAAFKSSVGKRIQVATGRGLTVQERRMFGESNPRWTVEQGLTCRTRKIGSTGPWVNHESSSSENAIITLRVREAELRFNDVHHLAWEQRTTAARLSSL